MLVKEPYKDYENSANKKPEAETNPRNVFHSDQNIIRVLQSKFGPLAFD